MKIQIPELSLVLLIGPSGCGKSSFARKHFLPTEVISSDFCRGLVADDENDQSATGDAFDLVHSIARKRLGRGRLTVIDATNVQPESRKPLVELAREYHTFPVAIVFDLPEKLCHERNASRPDRQFGPHVVRNQAQQMRRSLRGIEREGFRYNFRLCSPEEVEAATIERQPLWNKTDWLCLDCELMPWSVKAQELLRQQYAPAGTAGVHALSAAGKALVQARQRVDATNELAAHTEARLAVLIKYRDEYRRYCWPVSSIADLKLAPFHLLASEGKVRTDKPHNWHMETLARLCDADPQVLLATPFRPVDLNDPESCEAATSWWAELTSAGNEGIVVKPLDFISKGRRGYAQPAVKCRGPEYLRIIYGPEYLLPENLERLRARGLGAKRSLASREFALGIEALERFVRKEPLRRTHECVFGVLALESEPVDPRL